jgi:hypothetical protein
LIGYGHNRTSGRARDAGELLTVPIQMDQVSGTEGATLPANLSGISTASNWPLWKWILLRKIQPTVKVNP